MKEVTSWLADDRRARGAFWLAVLASVAGGAISLAIHERLPLVNDAVVVLNAGLIAAVIVLRALAVHRPWWALGAGLEAIPIVLHWYPAGVLALLAPLPGPILVYYLVFYARPPGQRDHDDVRVTLEASGQGDGEVGSPEPAPPRRPRPGDPDFTYPAPPR